MPANTSLTENPLTVLMFEELRTSEEKLVVFDEDLRRKQIMANLTLRRAKATLDALQDFGACGNGRVVICKGGALEDLMHPPKRPYRPRRP